MNRESSVSACTDKSQNPPSRWTDTATRPVPYALTDRALEALGTDAHSSRPDVVIAWRPSDFADLITALNAQITAAHAGGAA
ncbi:hypothetical protein [Rhodococcus ruber]|uniref:hypothetical protein n=1 Tax=Rhodococcus ruber TaxID=1830 RepID=UPI001F4464EF|nr:hypothetical protein [Rhodococcus ruber]MCF8786890.1 hypothetical protein [Rhodococcus ruber]